MHVPFFKASIGDAEIAEVIDTLRSGWLTTGPKTKRFETEFSEYIGAKHAIALNSATAALHLALEAAGVRAGDTVLVPSLTFAATAEVVRYLDAQPVLVDCRESDLGIDIADARRRAAELPSPVKAIVPVHYGGQVCDIEGVHALARDLGATVIEDAAHCCPAYYRESTTAVWKMVGSDSAVTCFSFYANKCITTGEGGMACTDDDALADRMRMMSLHGISKDAWKRFSGEGSWFYEILAPGFKYNLTDIAAAMGIHQLAKATELRDRRAAVASHYDALLGGVDEIILPRELANRQHSWHLYAIRLRLDRLTIDRAEFIAQLKQCGVTASVHWIPLHMQPYYRDKYGYRPEDLPVAASIGAELVSLPIFPDMAPNEVEYVCTAVSKIVSAARIRGGVA